MFFSMMTYDCVRELSSHTCHHRSSSFHFYSNPSCTEGVPIALHPKHRSEMSVPLEVYENYRSTDTKRKRGKKLVISVEKRAAMLLAKGYSMDELADKTIEISAIQQERQRTIQGLGMDKFKANVVDVMGRTLFLPKDLVMHTGSWTGNTIKKMVAVGKGGLPKSNNATASSA
jgi:hypothetical protein